MGSEVAAACCCGGDFGCVQYCACVPSQVNLSVDTEMEWELRYMGDPTNLAQRTYKRIYAQNIRLTPDPEYPCLLQSVEDIGLVGHELIDMCGSAPPNYGNYAGTPTPPTPCDVAQCYPPPGECRKVYPCFTTRITCEHPTVFGNVGISCYDPCRAIGPGDFSCNPEGYPYMSVGTFGGPSTITQTFHCPWNLVQPCSSAIYNPGMCCGPEESFTADVSAGINFWGKRGCLALDSFSAEHMWGGPFIDSQALPRARVCPQQPGYPTIPIPMDREPPNGLYNAYTCTPGSCFTANPPTTIPNRPINYSAYNQCVICAPSNEYADVHGCWQWTWNGATYCYTNMTRCNCDSPPQYITPAPGQRLSAYGCPTYGNGGQPWPTFCASSGEPCEPISCPDTKGCGCMVIYYRQQVNVNIHSIVP